MTPPTWRRVLPITALFSVFPLVLGHDGPVRRVPGHGDGRITRLTQFANEYLPGTEDLIRQNVESALALRGAIGLFAVLGLFWSASAVFGALNRSINRAWDIQNDLPSLQGQAKTVADGGRRGVPVHHVARSRYPRKERPNASRIPAFRESSRSQSLSGEVFLRVASGLLTLAIFLLIYRYMPNTKTYWQIHLAGRNSWSVVVRNRKERVHHLHVPVRQLRERLRLPGAGDRPAPLGVRGELHPDPRRGDQFRIRTSQEGPGHRVDCSNRTTDIPVFREAETRGGERESRG